MGFELGVTAAQVKLLANQVNAQVMALQADAQKGAGTPGWNLRTGTAFLAWVAAWNGEYQAAQDDSFFQFGTGQAYDRIREYQTQAREWQVRIAEMSGFKSSIPDIATPSGLSPVVIGAGLGIVAVAALLFLARK
jgi:hypothetical protein